MSRFNVLVFIVFAAASGISYAHGDKPHATKAGAAPMKKEQKAWGIAGDNKAVTRTERVNMTDDMRFSVGTLEIPQGQTIRFVVTNSGKVTHEFVIGTPSENEAHAAMMIKHPGMEHDEPYMVHVQPSKTGELIWQFNRVGTFEFACLIAGHYQAGMKGTIKVLARTEGAKPAAPASGSHKH